MSTTEIVGYKVKHWTWRGKTQRNWQSAKCLEASKRNSWFGSQ